jgi:hypothetical protein
VKAALLLPWGRGLPLRVWRMYVGALLIFAGTRLLGGLLRPSRRVKAAPAPEELYAKAVAWANLAVGVIEEGGAD